ncbi:hypothetical protein G4B88_006706 [Cannabis sativa]|uniref:Uncharacterized protein n=1 Tax=Cannabis sativa TaxID=3483 RepID=A0A7J6GVP6_CANSA|nr:hypothetical protein G4B88_006706 [Cannabis sativa]
MVIIKGKRGIEGFIWIFLTVEESEKYLSGQATDTHIWIPNEVNELDLSSDLVNGRRLGVTVDPFLHACSVVSSVKVVKRKVTREMREKLGGDVGKVADYINLRTADRFDEWSCPLQYFDMRRHNFTWLPSFSKESHNCC